MNEIETTKRGRGGRNQADARIRSRRGIYLPAEPQGRGHAKRSRPGMTCDGRGSGVTDGGHFGSRRASAGAIHYEIVNVVGQPTGVEPETHEDRILAPGCYATTIVELPASQAAEGLPLARGFYAVLWAMDDDASNRDEGPRHIGPFPSARQARHFIDAASAPR